MLISCCIKEKPVWLSFLPNLFQAKVVIYLSLLFGGEERLDEWQIPCVALSQDI